jgi:hypothetical protein
VLGPYRIADNFYFGKPKFENDNYTVPVYFNGRVESNQAISFKFDNEIIKVEGANGNVMTDFNNKNRKAVIISDGYFSVDSPVAFITLPKEITEFNATCVKFYGKSSEDVSVKFDKNSLGIDNYSVSVAPNPATSNTAFIIDIVEAGDYRLTIADQTGNIVRVINSTLSTGTQNIN